MNKKSKKLTPADVAKTSFYLQLLRHDYKPIQLVHLQKLMVMSKMYKNVLQVVSLKQTDYDGKFIVNLDLIIFDLEFMLCQKSNFKDFENSNFPKAMDAEHTAEWMDHLSEELIMLSKTSIFQWQPITTRDSITIDNFKFT